MLAECLMLSETNQGEADTEELKNGAKYLLSLALSNKWDTSLSRNNAKVAANKHMEGKQLLSL
jgi:hypothetical protein